MPDAVMPFEIREDDLSGADTQQLLRFHLAGMHASSPPGTVFALDLSGLRARDVTVWSAWSDDAIAGFAALKDLGGGIGEVKSMRTHPAFLRRGVGSLLVADIVAVARARGLSTLSLETGHGPAFAPAIAMYLRHGFVEGDAFSDYVPNGFSRFFHRQL